MKLAIQNHLPDLLPCFPSPTANTINIIMVPSLRALLISKPKAPTKSFLTGQNLNPAIPFLCSMTPPIRVTNPSAAEYIQSLLHDNNRETLREEHLSTGKVELYVLSYRRESYHRTPIPLGVLKIAIEVISNHATEVGKKFYSICIDSLIQHPPAYMINVYFAPYTIFNVVAIASEAGFKHDLKYASIRCEHQLASNTRGILIHPAQKPPPWTTGLRHTTGKSHKKFFGSHVMPDYAIRALASSVCMGLLEASLPDVKADLDELRRWAFMHLYSSDSGRSRYNDAAGIVRGLLENSAALFVDWKRGGVIVEKPPIIRPQGTRRRFDGAVELIHSVSRYIRVTDIMKIDETVYEEIRGRSKGYLITCTKGHYKGLYICFWNPGRVVVMELDILIEEDDSVSIVGYRLIFEYSVRTACERFLKLDGGFGNLQEGRIVCDRSCCGFMKILTQVWDDGSVADEMRFVNCSNWFVGML